MQLSLWHNRLYLTCQCMTAVSRTDWLSLPILNVKLICTQCLNPTPYYQGNIMEDKIQRQSHCLLLNFHLWVHPYLCGKVERPEDKSKYTARHYSNDRECQQAIPLAVVLHVSPGFHRQQTFPNFMQHFHPDSVSVCIPADPPSPRVNTDIQIFWSLWSISTYPTRSEAAGSQ